MNVLDLSITSGFILKEMTVSKLAKQCGLARTTILYYEAIGLIKPLRQGTGRYRVYGEKDLERLRKIRAWRDAGLTLADILAILDGARSGISVILTKRLAQIDAEIEVKRGQQRAILLLLRERAETKGHKNMTKEKWTTIMRAAGIDDEGMRRWHAEFERAAPGEHREFLEYLKIPGDEILSIRAWSSQAQPSQA